MTRAVVEHAPPRPPHFGSNATVTVRLTGGLSDRKEALIETSTGSAPTRRRPRGAFGPTIFAAVLCLISGYMAVEAFSFPYRPRLAPLLFSGLTFMFGLIVLAAEALDLWQTRRGRRHDAEVRAHDVVDDDAGPVSAPVEAGEVIQHPTATDAAPRLGAAVERLQPEEYTAFGYVVALVASFYLLGFIIGMSVFMAFVMRLYGRESWRITISVTVGVMAVMYFLFVQVLGVRVYPGRLGTMLPLPF